MDSEFNLTSSTMEQERNWVMGSMDEARTEYLDRRNSDGRVRVRAYRDMEVLVEAMIKISRDIYERESTKGNLLRLRLLQYRGVLFYKIVDDLRQHEYEESQVYN